MSVQIKSLTNGVPQPDGTTPSPNDFFNILEMANTVYDLYTAPQTPTRRDAIVKNIRLYNSHTAAVKVNLYFTRINSMSMLPRRRQLTPLDLSLPAGFTYIDDQEITLEPGDKIQGKADFGKVIQFVISGVERDES